MGRRRKPARGKSDRANADAKTAAKFAPPPPPDAFGKPSGAGDPVTSSGTSLHELFAQQTRAMLDRTDLDEEQKQSILVAMSCPCCGAGGISFTAKIKRRS